MNCKFLPMTNLGQFCFIDIWPPAFKEQNKEHIFVLINFCSCFNGGQLHICLICHRRDRRNGCQLLKLHFLTFSFEPLRQAGQSLQSLQSNSHLIKAL